MLTEMQEVEAELKQNATLLYTSKLTPLKIYTFLGSDLPRTLNVLGKLRESAFRSVGGGSGKEVDVDSHDLALPASQSSPLKGPKRIYKQIVVWQPQKKMILSSSRVYHRMPADFSSDYSDFATLKLFQFSAHAKERILPRVLDIGRLFVTPSSNPSPIDRLEDKRIENVSMLETPLNAVYRGIGIIASEHAHIQYMMGRLVIDATVKAEARDLLIRFFHDCHGDFLTARPKKISYDPATLPKLPGKIQVASTYRKKLRSLFTHARENDIHLPTLAKVYLSFSDRIHFFGGALDTDLGNTEELGILLPIRDLHPQVRRRYMLKKK